MIRYEDDNVIDEGGC